MTFRCDLRLPLALLAPLLMLLVSCGGDRAAVETGPVVLAASSMQEAMEDIADAWEAEGHPAPVLSFAASSALARQIEQGAPADLFVSADEHWMDELEGKSLLRAGSRGDVAGNALVVIARRADPSATLDNLGGGRLALGDPSAVPVGRYAKASLERLGLWDKVSANVVPAENTRAALALVERGEAALGIVYVTDAEASDGVVAVRRLPADSHPPIRYPASVLQGSKNAQAPAFRAFLDSPQAQRIFARRGFAPAE